MPILGPNRLVVSYSGILSTDPSGKVPLWPQRILHGRQVLGRVLYFFCMGFARDLTSPVVGPLPKIIYWKDSTLTINSQVYYKICWGVKIAKDDYFVHKVQALQRKLLDRPIKGLCVSISLKAKNRCLHSFNTRKRSFTKVHIYSKVALLLFILPYILFWPEEQWFSSENIHNAWFFCICQRHYRQAEHRSGPMRQIFYI